jgi:hypothetical protein
MFHVKQSDFKESVKHRYRMFHVKQSVKHTMKQSDFKEYNFQLTVKFVILVLC